ncbi:MAG: ELWxxDGT repeat protein [Acidobacteriota bacterium]
MKRGILLGFALLLPALAPALVAQPAMRLLDINTAPLDPGPGSSGFTSLRRAGDRLWFLGYRADLGGSEVWVSDGTPTGTQPLRTLCAGSCGNNPSLLGALGKLMLWTGDSESDRQRLWRSDGTGPGTFVLTGPGLRVQQVAFLGRFAYLGACSGAGTEEDCGLWRTDGSAAGTRLVHDIPGTLAWLHPVGDRLYYATGDSQGYDLWRTDGSAAGTVKLHRYESPTEPPHSPAAAGGRLFFIAWNVGREVWTSDGTAAGTRSLTAFEEDNPFGISEWLMPVGGRVYFLAHDPVHARELWRSDGTTAGTVRVTDFAYASPFPDDIQRSFLAAAGDTLVFLASGDVIQPLRLWRTAGTPESTAPLPDPCDDCSFDLSYGLTESGGRVFFLVQNPGQNQTPTDLWITDGSAAGTRRLGEVCATCFVESVFPWKGGVLLVPSTPSQRDLWISDGTAAGTKAFTHLAGSGSFVAENLDRVEELGGSAWFFVEGESPGLWRRDNPGITRQVFVLPAYGSGSLPERLAALEGKLLFLASDGVSYRLWTSAGTPQTTAPLDVPGLALSTGLEDTTELVPAAGLLFFQAGHVFEEFDLWRTDGTVAGTILLAHLPARSVMVPYGNALYFFKDRQIWRTDGTVAGTVKTGDFPEDLAEVEFAAAGANGLYLKTVTLPYQTQFWFTDGTTAGTRQITGFPVLGVASGDPELTASGPWMYFSWQSRLWKSDGTPAGTTAVEGLPGDEFPAKLLDHQGTLYFFMTSFDSTFPLQLWRTDGTTTTRLATFPGQDSVVFPLKLTPFGGKVFFNVDDGVHGVELWSTDGTPAGTGLVRDLLPGFHSSKPTQLTAVGGTLFFTAADELHGRELWQSDGTASSTGGTRLVQDVAPQQLSSDPRSLTPAGDRLYFTADDDAAGREVWVLPLSGAASCQPSETRLCLGGRYAVEAVWRDFQGNQGAGHAAPLTADTGTFWFFSPANVEVVLKVLDGRGINDHVWVFYGALSNVGYSLTVTDTQTGLSRRYLNPSGQLASVADTSAFGPRGARESSVAAASPPALVERKEAPVTAACAPSSTRLCLNGDRFAVDVAWKDFQGKTGVGKAVGMTGDTGYFWFFDEANVELVLKVLDGRPVNGHHWVFYGALSSVEYTITVTDTQTGEINIYRNPSGRLASVADTEAF